MLQSQAIPCKNFLLILKGKEFESPDWGASKVPSTFGGTIEGSEILDTTEEGIRERINMRYLDTINLQREENIKVLSARANKVRDICS